MNVVESYLIKVYSVEPYIAKEEWAKTQEWVKVKAMFNSYGHKHTETRVYNKKSGKKLLLKDII